MEKTNITFQPDIAKKTNIECAGIFEFLNTLCEISKAQNKEKMYQDNLWWCNCPKVVLERFFPYLTKHKITSSLKKLEDKGLIVTKGSLYATNIKGKPKKETHETTETETKDKVFNITDPELNILQEIPATKLVAMYIDEFKHVNPNFDSFFAQNAQRNALYRMLEKYNTDLIMFLIKTLPQTNQEKFAPMITTPRQLESKAPQLVAFIQRESKYSKNTPKDIL